MLLENPDKKSVHRFVRATLDPVLRQNYRYSHFVDPNMAFIPLLTNQLVTLSGWPDNGVDPFTSSEGLRKEVYTMADGHAKHYGSFTLSAEFKNSINSPIAHLFWYWTQYQMLVHEGKMMPSRFYF